jgi:hypothetical protein
MCTWKQTLFFNWGRRSVILENSAKTRIVSFEIQRTRRKPRPKESLTPKHGRNF